MERGLDQLIFFAFIVLAALVDWVVRVIRNRNAPPRPPVEDEEAVYFEDEAEYPEQEVAPQWHEEPRAEPVALQAPAHERVFDAPVPADWRRAQEERQAPEGRREVKVSDAELPEAWRRAIAAAEMQRATARVPVHVAPPVRPQAPVVQATSRSRPPGRSSAASEGSNRWRRDVLWLKDVHAARRAIVMMAVLGPCRALEDQPRP
ncbi:MAG: hypothetical protein H0X64_00635 [Gemmatimonadaceae bacterium]|nr:hypothetical protein [Gemmatimonadaceae bacterium]